jgi:hypothetical protein
LAVSGRPTGLAAAFIDPQNLIIVTSPKSAMNLKMALGYEVPPVPILSSMGVPVGTAIGIAPEAIASGYDGVPEVEIGESPSLHFDDSVPLDLVSGSGTVATPMRGMFQAGLTSLKLRTKCCWAALAPGAVQVATGIKW